MELLNSAGVQSVSVLTCVDALLAKAIEVGASDIHIEPTQMELRVRYRIDGVLYEQASFPISLASQIISRIKILAHIDITQKRIPQDGKFQRMAGDKPIDIRVSTFPCVYGETVVIRILDRAHLMLPLESLGLSTQHYHIFGQALRRHNGLVLVTGPTGSGKTTTLYAALSELNTPDKNIITLEDPVECVIEGITQSHIQPDVGFTFARGIRSMLRQDPDIVMIGEIRDAETAQTAVEAALTGHLVLSTLHTNDAPTALMRLMDMGIEPFLLNASITCVLAQRLLRKLCGNCKYEYAPTGQEDKILHKINLETNYLYASKGCEACFNLGYKGRVGIFEILTVSDELRLLIVHHPRVDQIYAQARADGMSTLLDDAREKVKEGTISLQELMRVLL
jgi:type II secretory ATPase GspE/PulE/Tfp pilus assembly ATPase PilB-like protein